MPEPDDQSPPPPGGPPAERLREFLRERLPPGTPPEELNPETLEKIPEKPEEEEKRSD